MRNWTGRNAAAGLAAALAMLLLTPGHGWGYAEDIGRDSEQPHSTFHYELTRALARAAGYSSADADLIGIAAAATDSGTFKGDLAGSRRITIQGTDRSSEAGQYYHFGRRHSTNATGEYVYPGARDECPYFTERNLCPVPSEIDEIELWAAYAQGAPTFGVPQYALDGGAAAPVEPRSSVALGIYLHALADSYSHEKCMEVAQVRMHFPDPKECTGVFWHEEAEFGVHGDTSGVPYTKDAGRAVWTAIRWFRKQAGLPDAILMNEEEVELFVDRWAEFDAAPDRRDFAVAGFESLNAVPTATPTGTPPPTATPAATPQPTALPAATATPTRDGNGGCSLSREPETGLIAWLFAGAAAFLLRRRQTARAVRNHEFPG
ncbi:hypothetical protein L6Q96_12935 [Candidatus Binatia bacterium]|nr:hypothetical protein [Candidatus Binatia bacterium]